MISYQTTIERPLDAPVHVKAIYGAALLAACSAIALAVSPIAPLRLLLGGIGLLAGLALFVWPEVALAAFMSVGAVKGNPTLSAFLPIDLTVAVAAILVLACVFKVLQARRLPQLWPGYLSYAPLSLLMLFSLLYTPDFGAGLDKTARFITLGGVSALAPFVILDSARKVTLFLYTLVLFGIGISAYSLRGLGGYDRLVAPGGLTLQLGVAAGFAIAILWTMIVPGLRFWRRILLYPVLAVLIIALVGSGARGAAIGVTACVIYGLFVYRALIADVVLIGAAGLLGGLSLFSIPHASYRYLSTLLTENPNAAMGLRTDMLELGSRLIWEHPATGVGVGGYAFFSRNPLLFGWPHNLLVEIAAELGLLALCIFLAQLLWAGWEGVQQIMDRGFPFRQLSVAVLALIMFDSVQMIKSGNINDNRDIWLLMGLPFVLRRLAGAYSNTETALAEQELTWQD